ncbi:MAG: acyltransferase [Bacteroidota bacterium]
MQKPKSQSVDTICTGTEKTVLIHPSAEVQSRSIGKGTIIGRLVIILPGAEIGEDCDISSGVFIENDVVIGRNVTIQREVYLWDGLRIGDDVLLCQGSTFVNDKYPRSKKFPDKYPVTRILKGVTVGANATILSGITIGEYALIGAGSVVTCDVPSYCLVYGNPARIKGKVNKSGSLSTRIQDKEKKKRA